MDEIELYQSLHDVSIADFFDRLCNVESFAYRLELLQQFSVENEKDSIAEYLNGKTTPPEDFNSDWRNLISQKKSEGKKFSRVRYISYPLTEYTKYEISWGYSLSIKAGEEILAIEGDQIPTFNTNVPILKDFWVIDNRDIFLMEYDIVGTFLGIKSLPQKYHLAYLQLMTETQEKSIDIQETRAWTEST